MKLEIFTVRSTGTGKCNAKNQKSKILEKKEWGVVYSRYGCLEVGDVLVRIQKYHMWGAASGTEDPNSPM